MDFIYNLQVSIWMVSKTAINFMTRSQIQLWSNRLETVNAVNFVKTPQFLRVRYDFSVTTIERRMLILF